jgi:hypothetical protein
MPGVPDKQGGVTVGAEGGHNYFPSLQTDKQGGVTSHKALRA